MENEDVVSKFSEHWVPSAVVMILIHCQHQKVKKKNNIWAEDYRDGPRGPHGLGTPA